MNEEAMSAPMSDNHRDIMGGLAKGLSVIETFTAASARQSIAEVAAASGLDRATARRCLLTLAQLGYADYDGKYFTLTPRILRLGTACLATMPLPQIVQPMLDRLSEELRESTSVSILDGNEIVYVARATQRRVISISLMAGSRLPAYCTSMGRVLLAALDEGEVRRIVYAEPLQARTQLTLTDPDQLIVKIRDVREQGYAIIDQEVELGLRSIAVPLINTRGLTVAALNLGVPVIGDGSSCLVDRYLPALRKMQYDIKKLLR